MHFASDNAGPTHPKILEAVIEASSGYAMPYGADRWAEAAKAEIRETFEAPEAEIFFIATGTATNSMILGALAAPWSAIFCHERAHILIDESNAPEFFTHGARIAPVGGAAGKMDPKQLDAMLSRYAPGDIHTPAQGPVSITNVTEAGTVYKLPEIDAISTIAADKSLALHLDGARFGNACAALGCSAAEMSWKRGVAAVSFGGTKNGCMSVEAAIFFDRDLARNFERIRMRSGHLFSKHRLLSAQMSAYLKDGLWLDLAGRANAAAADLASALGNHVEFVNQPEANMLFVTFPRALHRKLRAAGAQFYSFGNAEEGPDDAPLLARLVCDWSATPENTERFATLLKAG